MKQKVLAKAISIALSTACVVTAMPTNAVYAMNEEESSKLTIIDSEEVINESFSDTFRIVSNESDDEENGVISDDNPDNAVEEDIVLSEEEEDEAESDTLLEDDLLPTDEKDEDSDVAAEGKKTTAKDKSLETKEGNSAEKEDSELISDLKYMDFEESQLFSSGDIASSNVAIYSNLLLNRSFVEDTFLGDSAPVDNPYFTTSQPYLYADLLQKYESDAVYRELVNIYYRLEHIGEDIADIHEGLAYIFGNEEEWKKFKNCAISKN